MNLRLGNIKAAPLGAARFRQRSQPLGIPLPVEIDYAHQT